ncbi:MAG: toxin-antitoxin system YwqK family antitoxin [Fusobacteriaceae bacterium]|nr:toxin-antitoxin system YwqK family antitoxin [Fusobacteriaceae bacterium]
MKIFKILFIILFTSIAVNKNALSNGKFREIKPLLPNNSTSNQIEEDIVIQEGKNKTNNDSVPSSKKISEVQGNTTFDDNSIELIPIDVSNIPIDIHIDNTVSEPNNDSTENTQTVTVDNTEAYQGENIPVRKVIGPPSERNLDFSKKDTIDNIVYAKGDDEPYTGIFSAYIGTVIEYSETYIDGVLDGEEIWYSNGEPNMVYVFKNGKLNGDSYIYYDDGKVKGIQSYKDDKILAMSAFNKNGKSIYQATFTNGTGDWKLFWDNGNPLEEGHYINWKKDGDWKRFQSDGTVDNIKNYKDGKLISESWN